MADKKKIYYVGEKASFAGNGRIYKPGDEIDGGIFSEADLAALVKGGKLLTEAQFKESGQKTEKPADPTAGSGQKPLNEMSADELKAYAKEKNISLGAFPGNDKDKILETIKKAEEKTGN